MSSTPQGGALAPWVSCWKCGTQIVSLDVPWSPAQRALIKSLDCVDLMTPEENAAYTAIAGLKPWKPGDKPEKFNLWVLPRGSGKTSISALVAVRDILCNTYRQGPGETCLVAIMSPTVRQARDAMRYVSAYCESPVIAPLVESSTVDEIRFKNNRVIRVVPVNKKGGRIRGATFLTLIMDEAAFLEHSGVMVDKEIFNAVVAGFRNVSDYRALIISTPNGKTGLCWDFYEDHYGKAGSGVFVAHTTIDVIRPNMDAALLEQIRNSDPDSYKVEFLCEWASGGAKRFFIEQSVEDCIQKGVSHVLSAGPTSEYFAAVDVSGGKRDRHAVTVVRRLEDRRIQQVASLVFDPQTERYTMREAARQTAELCAEYGIKTVVSDVYGGNYAIEAHAEFGLTVEIRGMNNTLKIQRARALDELMQAAQVLLLDNEVQTREILQYERRELPSGAITCGHPNSKTASDDMLDALLLATYEALGHVGALHPPASMQVWHSKKWKDDLFAGGRYPNTDPEASDSIAKIMSKGPGPAWTLQNWSRDWRYCQCSLGELAWLCGVGPYQMAAALGRDLVLQLTWARFILASWIRINPEVIFQIPSFPGIPAWAEVKKRLKESASFDEVIAHEVGWPFDVMPGFKPPDWLPVAVKSRDPERGVSTALAYRPWTKPNPKWGLNHDVRELYNDGFPNARWARDVEEVFSKIRMKEKEEAQIGRAHV